LKGNIETNRKQLEKVIRILAKTKKDIKQAEEVIGRKLYNMERPET
jgi:hypothetical protein